LGISLIAASSLKGGDCTASGPEGLAGEPEALLKPLRKYRGFCDIKNGGCRYLEFSKIRNFNSRSAVRGQCASSCQISSKSVERFQTYGDLTVFKMAAVRHVGFVKFEIFNGRSG